MDKIISNDKYINEININKNNYQQSDKIDNDKILVINRKFYILYYNIIRKINILVFLIICSIFYGINVEKHFDEYKYNATKIIECIILFLILIDCVITSIITKFVRYFMYLI